jgi:8-oxo-dGTP pyrophosphatase MutT (NUDIX family)
MMNTLRQELQAALARRQPLEASSEGRVSAAVLVPFLDRADEPHVLFTKRTEDLLEHRGEICFPGGAADPGDLDLRATALRELYEELRVPAEHVDLIGRLDSFRTVVSRYVVTPYVGILNDLSKIQPNQGEVQEILEIPFSHFADPQIFRMETRVVDHQSVPVYYYRWRSHVIWGLTARILKNLLDLLEPIRSKP